MSAVVLRGDARRLPLPDACADLIVTSPPFWQLRSYTDGGVHYAGQLGSEPTPGEYVDSLLACTREWMRVLKPSGSLFVELGDKYSGAQAQNDGRPQARADSADFWRRTNPKNTGIPAKSLMGLPWRYAIRCIDELGLILRAEIAWHHVNGLPESVTDRVRRAHSTMFHFTVRPRYYAAVDEIREPHTGEILSSGARNARYGRPGGMLPGKAAGLRSDKENQAAEGSDARSWSKPAIPLNPLGKLPGSVWEIPSQPLKVPESLGVDHFACVDTETEILTPRGWLPHDQLIPGDQVAGYDLDTDTARWTECTAVNRYDYDGDLIAVESRDISMRLTPNHRTIVQRMDGYTKRRSPVSVVRADELDRYHFIPRSVTWRSDFYEPARIGERIAAVMGWVAAEGWYQGTGVWLSQSLEVNGPHVAEIDGLMPAAEIRTERKRTYKGRPWTEVTWKLGYPMALRIQHEMPGKLLPWWLVTATESERRAALNAFIAGDGHRRPDGRIGIFQKHRHNLDVLQAIAVTLGYKTTIREGGGRFVLYLTEGGRSVTLRGTSGVGSKVRREHYSGTVWCPTTGTGTFIARRNGSVFVTGNSFPMELPRRVILGWSPPGVCTGCGEGRRPVLQHGQIDPELLARRGGHADQRYNLAAHHGGDPSRRGINLNISGPERRKHSTPNTITGYACACTPYTDHPGTGERHRNGDHPSGGNAGANVNAGTRLGDLGSAERVGPWREYHLDGWTPPPARPALVVDPFGGTGTTALVASMLGRTGVSVDLSMDYARLAAWRTRDPGERARALGVPKPPKVAEGQMDLFDMDPFDPEPFLPPLFDEDLPA